MSNCPTGYRYATDNMWTSAWAEDLLPGIRCIIDTMPPYPAQLLLANWGPSPIRQDMAFSLASGIQLADENLGQRPAKFVSDNSIARLDKVRAEYDPHGRFHAWMGRL